MLNGWRRLTPEQEDLILRGIQDGRAYGGPFNLSLFPTDRCNLDCFFCYTEEQRETAAELEWTVLERTLNQAIEMGLKSICFGGGGEPFLYKHLGALLDIMDEHNISIESVKSNGTAITPELARRLVARDLQLITVSLNETTPETYAQMNQCSPRLFERAMAGARNLVRASRDAEKPVDIEVQIFVWKENFRRLEEMVETAFSTGVETVYINSIDQQPREKRMTAAEKEEFKPILQHVIERWPRNLRTNLTAEGLAQFAGHVQAIIYPEAIAKPDMVPGDERIEFCYMGWNSPVISANGDIYPCCHYSTNQARKIGNLHSESLYDIWHGKSAQQYRQEMRHLLLTRANPRLLPRDSCFIDPLCMGRTSCAFTYFLASPKFYQRVHAWAESGPRQRYTAGQQVRANVRAIARRAKRAVKSVRAAFNDPQKL